MHRVTCTTETISLPTSVYQYQRLENKERPGPEGTTARKTNNPPPPPPTPLDYRIRNIHGTNIAMAMVFHSFRLASWS